MTTMQEPLKEETDVEKQEMAQIVTPVNGGVLPPTTTTSSSGVRRSKYIIAAGIIVVLCCIACVILIPVLIIKNQSDGSPATTGVAGEVNAAQSPGPFNTSLSPFNENITIPYSSPDELKDDITKASWFLINNVVNRNLAKPGYESIGYSGGMDGGGKGFDDVAPGAPVAGGADQHTSQGSATEISTGNSNVNDYGTNNQEAGVEEGDLIVSDGQTVFAAYSDYIVYWGAKTGVMLGNERLPTINYRRLQESSAGGVSEPGASAGEGSAPGASGGDTGGAVDIMPIFYGGTPYIRSLLLFQDRLVVVAEGYGPALRAQQNYTSPILYDYLGTHIRIYNASSALDSGSNLTLLKSTNINGAFGAIRGIGQYAHVVTSSGIDTYTDLVAPFDVTQYGNVSEAEYKQQVQDVAQSAVIPNFRDRLVQELSVNGQMPNMVRINSWQANSTSAIGIESLTYSDGVMNSVTEVSSFDILDTSADLTVSVAGVFLPSYWSQVYSAPETMIIASLGWNYLADNNTSVESTYLVGMTLNGSSSFPRSVGSVNGAIPNSYAIDVMGSVLRLATTISTFWAVEPMMMAADGSAMPAVDQPESGGATTIAAPQSTTENYVITLSLPDPTGDTPGVMAELGRLQLGKDNETFTAVRFFDNVACAVTFFQHDPLYVLDLSDPTNLLVTGELNITGFSSTMIPMNDENTRILSIGEEADDQGVVLGLQVTVFDITTPNNPVARQRHVFEQDPNSYSYSEAEYNYLAVRYIKEMGVLVMPLSIYNWNKTSDNFDGFVVIAANDTLIEETCRISQDSSTNDTGTTVCSYCASLPQRAMVFDGNLMTTGYHTIKSTTFDTCEQIWSLNVMIDDPANCCYLY